MKILTIVGGRPQLIKVAPLSKELRKHHTEIIIHTGQHYDFNMSDIFFEELNIPKPDYNLKVGSGSHAVQTGHIMIKLEEVMLEEKPDFVIIYGDMNSTLASALTAAKLYIPIGHVEAGIRNFDMSIPEEMNRVIADKLSSLLFCPTVASISNLNDEGINKGVYLTGDVMYDAIMQNIKKARCDLNIPKEYIFCTFHRPSNVDTGKFDIILRQLSKCGENIIFPVHPRTLKNFNTKKLTIPYKYGNIQLFKPVSYLETLYLIKNAKMVITDSGGLQKETYILNTPCITVFSSTPWEETIADGWNIIIEPENIIETIKYFKPHKPQHNHYGTGDASKNIVKLLNAYEHTHSITSC